MSQSDKGELVIGAGTDYTQGSHDVVEGTLKAILELILYLVDKC